MFLLSVLLFALISGCFATIPRPRGVAISMASFYEPGVSFRCLDGSKEIPFDYVNDDYCDCPDGTDEPGTSACPSGRFHCTNAGFRPTNILSSRVNDGICDCCDGTDEWEGNIDCVNNCKELGKKLREEADEARILQEEGYKAKLKFTEDGKKTREEKKAQLAQLEQTKVELEAAKAEMEAKKTEVEAPEKEAKARHEQKWQEEVEKRKTEKETLRAETAFGELDTNKDNRVDIAEVKAVTVFDVDANGEVSDDEAKEHLEGVEHSDLDHFILKVWPNIKQFYKAPWSGEAAKGDKLDDEEPEPVKADPRDYPNPDHDVEEYDDEDDEEEDDEFNHEDYNDDDEDKEENKTEGDEEKMPDYDEQTKALIAAADEARTLFTDAEGKLKDTENEINSLNSYLNTDYGPEEEYSELKGNCYEYTDREYTYKLCAFDKASQRPKSGGSETTLGNWGHWDGRPDDKYSAQMYDNGQNCWNGPHRSVRVIMKCGLENKVISASEPSRCEYQFEFVTPSRCTAPVQRNDDIHDEL